jgi:hypothetical protein
MSEELNAIKLLVQEGITEGLRYGDISYTVSYAPSFYSGVDQFNALIVKEDDPLYEEYLDLRVYIGNILSDLRDKPINRSNTTLADYNQDVDTLEFVNEKYGSYDMIGDFYLINNVNTDFELLTSKRVLVPDYGL